MSFESPTAPVCQTLVVTSQTDIMTLIASYITKFGIIQASDSNLTDTKGNSGFGQKIFPIPHLNSSLAFSGCYSVDNKHLADWMNDFITGSYFTCKTIEEFCNELKRSLESNMREDELKIETIIHVAGYQNYDGKASCEHWHISNTGLIPETGEYTKAVKEFHVVNDFNSIKNPGQKTVIQYMDKNPIHYEWYINGFPPARISGVMIRVTLDEALKTIWNNANWEFRAPETIFDYAHVVKRYFEFITNLFPMSNYRALYIGGDIQTHLIPTPQNLDK